MFCVIDDESNIIAFHEEEEVVNTYIDNVYRHHKIELKSIKLKKKSEYKLKCKDDLYLVRYGKSYVQTGYLIYLQIADNQISQDNKYAKDILCRLLEIYKLSDKEVKTIEKSIKILDRVVDDCESYTPTLKQLKDMKFDYDPYFYNVGVNF